MPKQYLNTIENNIALFGHLFSDLHIRRVNSKTKEKQDIKIPISYMGKQRMFYLIQNQLADPNSIKVESVYPKCGYAITDMFPDWTRMTNPFQKVSETYGDSGVEVELNKIPFNIKFEVTFAVKQQTDLYMILEQILTWFKPSITIKAKMNTQIGEIASDINIVLDNGIFKDFNDEAPFSEKPNSPLLYGLAFTSKTWLWCTNDVNDDGTVGLSKSIKEIQLGVFPTSDFNEPGILLDTSYPIKINKTIEE